jgi:5'-nucleotidase
MSPLRVLIDMDGVLADWEGSFLDRWRAGDPDGYHVPLAARRTFRVVDQYPEPLRERVRAVYLAPGFYRDLPPIAGALDAVRAMRAAGHDVWICSSPLAEFRDCVLEKYEWVDTHLGPAWTTTLILTRDKTLVRGDVLIDDNPEVRGRVTPEWRHVVFDQPYNRAADARFRLGSWRSWREVLAAAAATSRGTEPPPRP